MGYGVVMLSIFYPGLNKAAKSTGIILGVLSLIAFLLLMLAATTGGGFRMSPNNQVIAVMLALMAFLGCTAFFWPTKDLKDNQS